MTFTIKCDGVLLIAQCTHIKLIPTIIIAALLVASTGDFFCTVWAPHAYYTDETMTAWQHKSAPT